MDEEDVADAEDAQRLQTATSFAGLGSTADELSRKDMMIDLARPAGETIGVKLLQRMGWKPGQGVGPKIRRHARLDTDTDVGAEEHLFAPENSRMIGFIKKNDFKGLGYAGETSLAVRTAAEKQEDDDDEGPLALSKSKLAKGQKKGKKSGLGVGVLNDTGSDEDPYEMGPKISYNRTIGADKKTKKNGLVKGSANPLLGVKPVFMSKKVIARKATHGFRKCHDGRLPLDGFILSTTSTEAVSNNKYLPPKIPEGWATAKIPSSSNSPSQWKSTSDAASASMLDPKARSALLGEAALPGKSVFDYISPATRDRLAAVSGRSDLPQALGETPPDGYKRTDADKQKHLWSLVPPLDKELARAALNRGVSGWMPYSEDESKRARYRAFLELRAGLRDVLPDRALGVSVEEWKNELNEFAHAAFVFRPATGMMASRFTSASKTFEGSFNPNQKESETSLLTKPTLKVEDPAEAAAKIGMYGPMTRSVLQFVPTRLLCKRFNVRPPNNVQMDPGASMSGEATGTSVPDVVSKEAMEKMMQDAAVRRFAAAGMEGGPSQQPLVQQPIQLEKEAVLDVERNEALEAARPGDQVFKAIFGSDDEDDE